MEGFEDRCLLSYLLTDLGTLGGPNPASETAAINAGGQVVGDSTVVLGGYHAFLYSGGGMTDLGTLGGSQSTAIGINTGGQVVGFAKTTGDAAAHAFLWSAAGGMTDLGTLDGDGLGSVARDINDSGQVVGDSTTALGGYHAFLYSGGVMTDLGTLGADGLASYAAAINAGGQVVGFSDTNPLVPGNESAHAFLWSGGAMTDLGTFGGSESHAYDINDSGQVVGSAETTGDVATHAFLYSAGAKTDLGTLGGSNSDALGINAGGQVVGESTTAVSGYHAFLYSGGVMTDLNDLIPAASGMTLLRATAINAQGQIAANAYDTTSGQFHAVLLTPEVSLSGTVFADANNNGQINGGEPGIAGITLHLTRTDDLGNSVDLPPTTTASDGSYHFTHLPPGTYTITEDQPAGYLDGRDSVGTVGGTADGAATNDRFSRIVLDGTNSNGVNYNFGELPFTSTSPHSLISSNFNGTAIAAGNTIWFNSVFTANGLSKTQPVTIRFVDQEIKFTANGVTYDLLAPNSVVTFSPATATATTRFDTSTQTWITNVPSSGLAGNIFLSGVGFVAPSNGLPGGISSVTWEGDFLTDTPGVRIQSWRWAAAVYDNTKAPTPFPSGFSVDYNPVAVKPVDDAKASQYRNSDRAGTPESYKPYVIGGARGDGGSNYTGSYSGFASVTAPAVIPNLGVLDPTASYDSAPWLAKKPKK